MEDAANRDGLELLELRRQALDAAMPAGKGAGADEDGKSVVSKYRISIAVSG